MLLRKCKVPPIEAEDKNGDHVQVVVRCRPVNPFEEKAGFDRIVTMDRTSKCLKIQNNIDNFGLTRKTKQFTFDRVYDAKSTQCELYEESVRPMVEQMFLGYNVTIFAYGQTGTGKTFTMEGNRRERGIMQNAFKQIFEFVKTKKFSNNTCTATIQCCYVEIYQGKMRDLLNSSRPVRIDTSNLKLPCEGLRSFTCQSEEDMEHCRKLGYTSRMTACTYFNEYSSRSHAIFVVTCDLLNTKTRKVMSQSKLNLVDLAGSESLQRSKATDLRLKECCEINLSLLAVNKVISSSMSGKSYIPYRDSLLTMFLQDSFGSPSTKTLMIANIGPTAFSYKETLTTLEYAHKAKKIKNTPKKQTCKLSAKEKYRKTLEELVQCRRELEQEKKLDEKLKIQTVQMMQDAVKVLLQVQGVDHQDIQEFLKFLTENSDHLQNFSDLQNSMQFFLGNLDFIPVQDKPAN
ncbi:hypothetical protein WDU94_015116 [Cyamophila willieti]